MSINSKENFKENLEVGFDDAEKALESAINILEKNVTSINNQYIGSDKAAVLSEVREIIEVLSKKKELLSNNCMWAIDIFESDIK